MGRKRKQLRLQVLLNGQQVGTLTRSASGNVAFAYTDKWLQTTGSLPVSQSMPLRESPYQGATVEAYFDNLLPDNDEIRRRLAERMATNSNKAVDLLAAVGRDCIGALQFIPEGEPVSPPGPIQGEVLSEQEIGDLLRHLKTAPLGLDREKEFRISIAGVQEKTALLYWKGRWHRPKGSTPTTHILKPAMGKLSNGIDMSASVQNEWLCLKLAEHFGLRVAKVDIKNFGGINCLVVERFDRLWSQNKKDISRIPQEDLCQALGIPWAQKYESDGGPGIAQIMSFLNASDQRERDRSEFMRAQLVFFLLGAIDGHAKNFSINLLSTGFYLTPIYDVVTVWPALVARQIEPKQAKQAMAIGNRKHYHLGQIQRRHWEQTAKATGFPARDLEHLLEELRERGQLMEAVVHNFNKFVPAQLITTVLIQIKKQLSKLF
ncbi:MAG: type II toxin-antitoxin system HipA family toxin [Deltaproteobacteria bacterium]|nr:type II toxin-antitoxin system HipA family toxin [Deltaproteobacteria bacterium]